MTLHKNHPPNKSKQDIKNVVISYKIKHQQQLMFIVPKGLEALGGLKVEISETFGSSYGIGYILSSGSKSNGTLEPEQYQKIITLIDEGILFDMQQLLSDLGTMRVADIKGVQELKINECFNIIEKNGDEALKHLDEIFNFSIQNHDTKQLSLLIELIKETIDKSNTSGGQYHTQENKINFGDKTDNLISMFHKKTEIFTNNVLVISNIFSRYENHYKDKDYINDILLGGFYNIIHKKNAYNIIVYFQKKSIPCYILH